MYVRPQPQNYKYSQEVRLPENYGGSTFREAPQEPPTQETVDEMTETEQTAEAVEAKEAVLPASSPLKLRLGSLFGGKIGTEEILILALILLLCDSEENDDLVLFLILLFFIK